GKVVRDLVCSEDSNSEVDRNVVVRGSGNIVEVQVTAEGMSVSRQTMDGMLDLAAQGIGEIVDYQKRLLLDRLK
ncbi:ribonuclease PH, partial [Candidatus Hakubella thermalkaliphila]